MHKMGDEYDGAFPFTPLVIIGAGRSGTNMLRDSLVSLPEFATWPCDEINPIWRHGNVDHPDDEIPMYRATPAVRRYIREAFQRIWRQQGRPAFVVEKTCANSLRVPFVDSILPEARYIYLVRNGYDVVASARKRWRGEFELQGFRYFLAKARYAPLTDLPRYAIAAIRSRLAVALGKRSHLGTWGPRFRGIDEISRASLDELVVRQWAACVNASDRALDGLNASRVFRLRYEDFTNDAAGALSGIAAWLEFEASEQMLRSATAQVRTTSVGNGRGMTSTLPNGLRSLIDPLLAAHGYIV